MVSKEYEEIYRLADKLANLELIEAGKKVNMSSDYELKFRRERRDEHINKMIKLLELKSK